MGFHKKSLGQHFLNNDAIAENIVDALEINAGSFTVVEVGPGSGVLTKFLVKKGFDRFDVVELDRRLIEKLAQSFPQIDKIVETDILKYDLAMHYKEVNIIGNFPYNISTQIIFKIIENKTIIPQAVGMFQKEVAMRLAAKPGSKVYGVTSVLTQAFYDVEYLFDVGKENFDPSPKVESGVLRMIRKEEYKLSVSEKDFFRVVKLAFSQRRKKLINALKPMLTDKNKEAVKQYLDLRAEVLSVEDYILLTQELVR